MSFPNRTSGARRLALVAAISVGASMLVTTVSVAQGSVASSQPRMSIEDLTAQWASLERPLLNVTELTDLQRDAIELLEERYRKLFNDEAGPIRAARVTLLQRGPFERQGVERALQRMAEIRRKELAQLRTLLTESQRVTYDQNLKVIAIEEAAAEARREREAAFVTP